MRTTGFKAVSGKKLRDEAKERDKEEQRQTQSLKKDAQKWYGFQYEQQDYRVLRGALFATI